MSMSLIKSANRIIIINVVLYLKVYQMLNKVYIKYLKSTSTQMDFYEKREQDFTKWDKQLWNSVERAIPIFQLKVAQCMLDLGSLTKQDVKDFTINPCLENQLVLGEELYMEILRPGCVKAGYVSKEIPTLDDLNADESEEEESDDEKKKAKKSKYQQVKKAVTNEQKKGKKGSKNNQVKNEMNIKMKIVKENLTQNLNDVLYSHSLERMQLDFNFMQNKLELKLITFFYIAFFIRKNKQKQNIDESQAFQLINIMLKVVRIFDQYKGRSFYSLNQNKQQINSMEISQTLILDLKMCIKGMKKFYKYTNKKIIVSYPKLLYYTSYDSYFPTLDITPYPSQIQFIQKAKQAFNTKKGTLTNPTLVLYHTMIGSGKTSASISLSNLIRDTKLLDQKNMNLQVLYCCLISSVRSQVGRYAYNKKQKFALSAFERALKNESFLYPRIINHNSCLNSEIVDIIISDLDCAYEMLSNNQYYHKPEVVQMLNQQSKDRKKKVNLGELEKQNIILFVDEPTAFCKSANSFATQNLFKILANFPPKLIIFASATMPTKDQIPNTIKLIEQRNPKLQVYQIDSKEFHVGCQYCNFKGQIIFPHTNVKNKGQLQRIINLIDSNAFLMRLYTGPSLYFLLKKCQNEGIKDLPKIEQLSQIKQQDISNMTIKVLNNLLKYSDDKIEQVCKLSSDELNLDYKIVESEVESDDNIFGTQKKPEVKQEQKTDYVNFKNMLRQDAYKFLGGCLIATENPLEFATKHFSKWLKISKKEYMKPVRRTLDKYQKDMELFEKEIKALEDSDEREENIMKKISKMRSERQPTMEFLDYKRINTFDHYTKYCANKQPVHTSMLIKYVPIQVVATALIEKVNDFILKLLFCGVALYMEKGLSSKYLEMVEELASQNLLAYIITDQSLCYGTNFPISNVIICDDLAKKLNMNEMFQLVGRAGRVGQSWTARAFLQEEGLQKLYNYIDSDSQKTSDQAEIFQTLAKNCLDNPKLTLRTLKSQVKYVDSQQPDDRIQIIIKKKVKQDYHVMRKVTLILCSNGKIFSEKCLYKSVNYFRFPQSEILYEDLPTQLNSDNIPIIDVSSYYSEERQFIKQTLNNAAKRILSDNGLQKLIEERSQVNEFKSKEYEDFFCSETMTFGILINCKEDTSVGNFQFHKLEQNKTVQFHYSFVQKIQKYIKDCSSVAKKFRKDPSSVLVSDIKKIKEYHQELLGRVDFPFYKQMFESCTQQIDEEFDELTSKIHNVVISTDFKIALAADKHSDFINLVYNDFHIDQSIRKNYKKIMKHVPKP